MKIILKDFNEESLHSLILLILRKEGIFFVLFNRLSFMVPLINFMVHKLEVEYYFSGIHHQFMLHNGNYCFGQVIY